MCALRTYFRTEGARQFRYWGPGSIFGDPVAAQVGKDDNIFIDCSSSVSRAEWAHEVSTCITPSHAIYSNQLHRYLEPEEILGCQAIWRCDVNNRACFDQMITNGLAQKLAGNAMTGTAVQAVVLASFASAGSWLEVGKRDKQKDTSISTSLWLKDQPCSHSAAGKPGVTNDSGKESQQLCPKPELQPPEAVEDHADGKGHKKRKRSPGTGPKGLTAEGQLVPTRRVRGKQALIPMPKLKKKGQGPGNKKAKGKKAMVTIKQKEDIFKAWEAAEANGAKHPAKEVEKLGLPGYFAGCTYPSKWGRAREEQHWTLLCNTAPSLCSRHRELPNSLRRVLNLTLKHQTHEVASSGEQSMPWLLKQIVEELVMERMECGEELGIQFVKNTITFCCGIWNECIDSMHEMVKSWLSKNDERFSQLGGDELEEKLSGMSQIAEKLLKKVHLAESDGALLTFANISKYILFVAHCHLYSEDFTSIVLSISSSN